MRDGEDAKEKIQDILDAHEYQVYYEDNRNFLEVWWDRFVQWLQDVLSEWFPAAASSSGLANTIIIIVVAAVIVLVGLVVFLRIRKTRQKRSPHDSLPLGHLKEREWPYERHLEEARIKEADEHYTEATRHLFLALILYFHEKGWLRAGDWKTNGEYFIELRQVDPQYADAFYHMAGLFDEVVYGKRVLRKEEYTRFRQEVMKWLQEAAEEQATGRSKGV